MIVAAVMPVERRKDVVLIQTNIIDVGRQEFDDGRECATIVAYRAEADLALPVVVVHVVEPQLTIGFRQQIAVAVGNGVHVGNQPERGITLPHVEVALDIDVGGEAADFFRGEIAAVVEDTTHDDRVADAPRENNTGHTCEYAQYEDSYESMAFHDDKITI